MSRRLLHYLLLQVRDFDDPMREHEVHSFARVLDAGPERIRVVDLLRGQPTDRELDEVDLVLLGGSGRYSAAADGDWLERALEMMRRLHSRKKPTFASCWGFQAMARALGGRVVRDASRAEIGTRELVLTEAGRKDPVFGPLGERFCGQMGHEDSVVALPPQATLLASSARVPNQAYRLEDAPVYCTQFHPELNRDDLMIRVEHYPEYIERIAGLPPERFPEMIRETPETETLLRRFITVVFGRD